MGGFISVCPVCSVVRKRDSESGLRSLARADLPRQVLPITITPVEKQMTKANDTRASAELDRRWTDRTKTNPLYANLQADCHDKTSIDLRSDLAFY